MTVIFRDIGLVTDDDVQVLAVRSRNYLMGAVLTCHQSKDLELYQFIEVVVTIRIQPLLPLIDSGCSLAALSVPALGADKHPANADDHQQTGEYESPARRLGDGGEVPELIAAQQLRAGTEVVEGE